MIPSDKCYAIIKHHESCVLKAYKDVAGVWTIGWGTTQYENGAPVKAGQVLQQWKADELLNLEVQSKARSVQNLTSKVQLKQCQFDALTSFAYNVGIAALTSSTLLRRVLKSPFDPTIYDCFLMWNKAHVDGKLEVVPGLTARRKSEAWLYANDELKYYHE